MVMQTPSTGSPREDLPIVALDLPVMYEDEGQEEIGETELHFETIAILRYGLKAHLAARPKYRVFSDLNLYYHPLDPNAYVSPDSMVVVPERDLGGNVTSYFVPRDGPAPVLTAEVLSRRSYQQQDTSNKLEIYGQMGVAEYVLVDVSGQFLPQRLMLKRLGSRGVWRDEQDADGGVTSQLGFRLLIEVDGQLRVVNAQTGQRYARPSEAEAERLARQSAEELRAAEAEARQRAEEQVKALQAQLAELRQQTPPG